jgi:hypothetical protein
MLVLFEWNNREGRVIERSLCGGTATSWINEPSQIRGRSADVIT